MGTWNYFGTHFFEAYEREPDGSFITTKWLCIALPLIPLSSYRIVHQGSFYEEESGFLSQRYVTVDHFNVIKKVPLYKRGVAKYYLTFLSSFLIFFGLWHYWRLIDLSIPRTSSISFVVDSLVFSFLVFAFIWGSLIWTKLIFKSK